MKRIISLFIIGFSLLTVSCSKEHQSNIRILVTNDLHGDFFDSLYIEGGSKLSSLSRISTIVNLGRKEVGEDSFILLDAGDVLQGDNACYYYNFVDSTGNKHLMSRLFNFLDYDAWIVGNHDIEAGHPVYDRVSKELNCETLGANIIDINTKKSYFKPYTILKKGGLKVAVIGMTNANIKSWLSEIHWKGLDFEELYPLADSIVQKVRREKKPDIVVLVVHAGIKANANYDIENPTLYLAEKVRGVDIVFGGHDHRTNNFKVYNGVDSVLVMEGGVRANNVAIADLEVIKSHNNVISKKISGSIVNVKQYEPDSLYEKTFRQDFETVRNFSSTVIGHLTEDVKMSDAEFGMSTYLNLVHIVELEATKADISFSAPLNMKSVIKAGQITFDDLFSFYQYENYLYKVLMYGREIKKYLEYSYYLWIEHKTPYFNFDSAGGLIYKVYPNRPRGNKVEIISLADGTPFLEDKAYSVAMTSYRASGAGMLLKEAGIDSQTMSGRIIEMYPEVRELIHQYILEKWEITPSDLENNPILGSWSFVR